MTANPQDFTGADLREQSFRGAALQDAILRGADVRGTRFEGADLRGADLRELRTGMHRGWALLVAVGAVALSVGTGVLAGYAGRLLQRLITADEPRVRAVGSFVLASLFVFLLIAATLGLRVAVRYALPVLLALAAAVGVGFLAFGLGTGIGALAAIVLVLGMVAIVLLASLARTLGGTSNMMLFAVVAISGALSGTLLGGGLAATLIAVLTMLIGRRALKTHAAYPGLSRVTSAVACRGGTSFRGADLTGANLQGAHLRCCDFRGAKLQYVQFEPAEVHLCRFEGKTHETASAQIPLDTRKT